MNASIGDNIVDALLFGMPSAGTASFIRQEVDRFVGSAVGEYGQRLALQAQQQYQRFDNSLVMGMMQAALNKSQAITKPDTVYRLRTMEDFQTAQPLMQSFIMAHPEVRKAWQNQLCDGYSETYVDMHPGKIGENHPHWQMAHNGLVKFGDDDTMEWTNYSNAFDENGEMHLNPLQQHTVLANFRALEKLWRDGEFDPTSVWNGKR